MPPWGKHGFYKDDEIKDIVAFLKTLKTPTKFSNPIDDPATRAKPVEDRDALDPFVNPAAERIDVGAALFKKPGPERPGLHRLSRRSKGCLQALGGRDAEMGAAAQQGAGRRGIHRRHAKATTGADWLMETRDNTDLSIYLHSLANGEAIKVDLSSPDAKAAYERGVALSKLKVGQFNFACTDCHPAGGQQVDPRPVAGRAQGPVRSLPAVAHQPQRDLGHPQALPMVQRPGARQRTAARRG